MARGSCRSILIIFSIGMSSKGQSCSRCEGIGKCIDEPNGATKIRSDLARAIGPNAAWLRTGLCLPGALLRGQSRGARYEPRQARELVIRQLGTDSVGRDSSHVFAL